MRLFLNKRIITHALKIAIGVSIYFYLLAEKKIDFSFFRHENVSILTQLFLLETLVFFIGAVRWQRIGKYAYSMRVSLLSAAHISWIGQFFSIFVPATLGTDFSRVYYGSKMSGLSKKNLVKVAVADRANSLFGVIICGFLGSVFYLKEFGFLQALMALLVFLVFLRVVPKRKMRKVLLARGFHLPPFSAIFLTVLNFTLKAFSLFIIIYFLMGKNNPNDYYLCLASQFIEGMAILPANIGIGHILFDKILAFIKDLNGAQVYNVYFTVKVLFKMTGLAGWLFYRKKSHIL